MLVFNSSMIKKIKNNYELIKNYFDIFKFNLVS